jgi:hypothetical protein
MIVKSLWIGSSLSRLEHACIKSWLNLGYEYHLYTYQEVENVPKGTCLLDANTIISKDRLFVYNRPFDKGGGSYSGFSNLFRYKLLLDGGIWADTDLYCAKTLPEEDYIFAYEDDKLVASCLLKVPSNSEFAARCFEVCNTKDSSKIVWGETGPQLVTSMVKELFLENHIRPQHEFFPVLWTDIDRFFEDRMIEDYYTVHFWNEIWRRKGLDKNVIYESKTLYEKLIAKTNRFKIF